MTPEPGCLRETERSKGLRFGRDEDGPAAVWASFVVEASHCACIRSGSAVVRLRRLAGAAARYWGARTPPPASERGRRERSHRPSGLARGFSAGRVCCRASLSCRRCTGRTRVARPCKTRRNADTRDTCEPASLRGTRMNRPLLTFNGKECDEEGPPPRLAGSGLSAGS